MKSGVRELNRSEVVSLVVLFIIVNIVTIDSTDAKCSIADCETGLPSNLKYDATKTYIYKFESDVTTQIVCTSSESRTFKLTGSAKFVARNASLCDGILTLNNVQFESALGNYQDLDSLEGSSIRFSPLRKSYQKNICLSPDDPSWSANIKRSLASMFSSLEYYEDDQKGDFRYETDISGYSCKTEYTRKGDIYSKTRDLNRCDDAPAGGNFIHLGIPFEIGRAGKVNGLFDSTQSCTYNFTSGLLQSAQCTETHKLGAFSTGENNGAQTKVVVSLALSEVQDEVSSMEKFETLTKSDTIDFDTKQDDFQNSEPANANAITKLKELSTKLCLILTTEQRTTPAALQIFTEMKKMMKFVNEADLKKITPEICESAKDMFMEAATVAGTKETINFVLNYENAKFVQKNLRLFTLYNVLATEAPDSDGILAITKLISDQNVKPQPQLLLTASGLAYKYSEHQNYSVAIYNALVDKIADYVNNADEKIAIVALQALGNLKLHTDKAIGIISSNLKSGRNGNGRLVINTIQAFRRNSCERVLRNNTLDIFSDLSQTSDVRIQAYLALVECIPERYSDITREMMQLLRTESSKQVLLFINSHVRNGRDRERHIPDGYSGFFDYILDSMSIPQDNGLKFSKNYVNFKSKNGVGHFVEGNVMYSTDSYLPRILEAKITFDLYGRTYHLAEVGVNLGGSPKFFEKVFGPNGKISKPKKIRPKRQTEEWDVENFIEKLYKGPSPGDNDKAVIDAHLRIFGTTIILVNFYNPEEILDNILLLPTKDSIQNIMEKGLSESLIWNNLIPLPEYERIVPTVSGFPLKLSLQATTSNSFNNFYTEDKSIANMRGSTSGNLIGRMTVGSGPVESGLEVEINLDMSGAILAGKSSDENQPFSFKVGIPTDRPHIAELKTRLSWFERLDSKSRLEPVTEENARPDANSSPICSQMISQLTELKVCSVIQWPNSRRKTIPGYPVNGQSTLSLSLDKSSPSVQGFIAEFKTTGLKGDLPNASGFASIVLDTPGSLNNLKTNLNLEVKSQVDAENSGQEMSLEIKLDSWWKDLKFLLKSSQNSSNQSYEILVAHDKAEYVLRGQKNLTSMTEERIGSGEALKTSIVNVYDLLFISPTGSLNLLKGSTTNYFESDESENEIEGAGASGDIELEANVPALNIQGDVSTKWERSTTSGDLLVFNIMDLKGNSKDFGTIELNGFANMSKCLAKFSLELDAKYGRESEHTATIQSSYDFTDIRKSSVKTQMISTRVPSLNFEGRFDADYKSEAKSIALLISHKASEFLISQDTKYKFGIRGIEMENVIDVSYPPYGVAWFAMLNFKLPNSDGQYLTNAVLKTTKGPTKEVSLDIKYGPEFLYEITTKLQSEETLFAKFFSELKRGDGVDKLNFTMDTSVQTAYRKPFTSKIEVLLSEGQDLVGIMSSNRLDSPIKFESGLIMPYRRAYLRVIQSDVTLMNFFIEKDLEFEVADTDVSQTRLTFNSSLQNVFDTHLEIIEARRRMDKKPLQLDFYFDWLPNGRRITHKFSVYGSEKNDNITVGYGITGDFEWDALRDSSKGVNYNITVIAKYPRGHFLPTLLVVRKELTVLGQTYVLTNTYGPRNIENDRALGFNTEYISPENQTYSGGIEALIPDSRSAQFPLKINLTTQFPGQELTQFPLEINFTHPSTIRETGEFDYGILYEHSVTRIQGHRYPSFYLNLKSKVQDDKRTIRAGFSQSGIPYFVPFGLAMEASYSTNAYDLKWSLEKDNKTSGGFSIDLGSKLGKSGLSLNTFLENMDTRNQYQNGFNSSLEVVYLFGSVTNFEVDIKELFQYNQNDHFALNQIVRISNGDFNFEGSATSLNSNEPIYHVQIQGDYEKLTGLLNVTHNGFILFPETNAVLESRQTVIQILMSPEFPTSGQNSISAKFPFQDFQALDFKVSSDLRGTGHPPFAEFNIAINNQPERTIKIEHLQKSRDDHGLRATVQWGTEKEQLSAEGNFKDTTNGKDIQLVFSCPAVKDVWTAKFSMDAGKYSFSLKSPTTKDEMLTSIHHHSLGLSGHWRIIWKGIPDGVPTKGEFEFNAPFINHGATTDFKFSASSEFSKSGKRRPFKLTILVDPLVVNKRAALSYCLDLKCQNVDLQFNTTSGGPKIIGTYGFDIDDGGLSTYGVLVDIPQMNLRETNNEVLMKVFREFQPNAHTEKFTRNFGFRAFRHENDGSKALKARIEIILPERIIATEITHRIRNGTLGTTNVNLKLWLNKEKDPENNLTLSLSTSGFKKLESSNWFKLIAQHPAFEKDLKFGVSFASPVRRSIQIKSELDIFKNTDDQIIFILDWKSDYSRIYSVSLESPGRGLSLAQSCRSASGGDGVQCFLDFKDSNSKTYKEWSFQAYERQHEYPSHILEFYKPGGEILLGLRASPTRISRPSSDPKSYGENSIEIQLAGMNKTRAFFFGERKSPDALVIQTVKTDQPTARAKQGLKMDFTELAFQHPERKMFAIPLTFNDASGSHLLTNLIFTDNNTCLFFVKFLWDNDRIQKYLSEAKLEFQETRDGIKKVLLSNSNDLSEIQNSISSSFEKSNVGLVTFWTRIKGQIRQIRMELLGSTVNPEPVTLNNVKDPTISTDIARIPPTPKNIFAIIDGGFEILNAFADRVAVISKYLSSMKNGSASSSAGISKSVLDGYRRLENAVGLSQRITDLSVGYKQLLTKLEGHIIGSASVKLVGYLEERWRQRVFKKYEDFYESLTNDLLLLFPYNETHEFQNSYNEFVNTKLFDEDETSSPIELDALVEKFAKALQKGLTEFYKSDYERGVISSQIPKLPTTNTWRYFWDEKPSKEPEFEFPSMSGENFPPADAYGVLIGRHFITFDGKVGTINSACKYLLASDVVHKDFNIFTSVKYDSIDEIYFTSNVLLKLRKKSVDLGRDTKIATINGVQYQPETYDPAEIGADGATNTDSMIRWVIIKDSMADGVEIRCSVSKIRDLCIFKISGYYHGRIRGLLGIYNNEPLDDFTVPSGKVVESNETFSNSWKTDSTCKEINDPSNVDSSTNECEAISEKTSPFRRCFNTVDPQTYVDLCQTLITNNYGTEKALCTVAFAYTKICEDSNILVEGFSQCSLDSQRYNYYYYN